MADTDINGLSLDEYARYGRQMIQPGWGLEGELAVAGQVDGQDS